MHKNIEADTVHVYRHVITYGTCRIRIIIYLYCICRYVRTYVCMCIRHCFLPAGYALRMHRRRLTCVQSVPSAHQALPKCSLARTRLSPLTTCLVRILLRLRSTKCAQRSLLKGEYCLVQCCPLFFGPLSVVVWQLVMLCLAQNLQLVTSAHVRIYVRTYILLFLVLSLCPFVSLSVTVSSSFVHVILFFSLCHILWKLSSLVCCSLMCV